MNFLAQEEDAAIPVHGYQDYSAAALERIHGVDQFLPIVATIYVFALTVIYAWQTCSRLTTFDRNMIPIRSWICI